jgi:hypothetical protein
MFCHMIQAELTVSVCPAKCQYKTATGGCGFTELTEDNVEPRTIAELKGEKVYKVKTAINQSVRAIKIGLAVDRYADFVKSSFPALRMRYKTEAGTVNGIDSHVSKVLRKVFGLTDNQQTEFWSENRYSGWASRTGSAFTLTDIKEQLATIKL